MHNFIKKLVKNGVISGTKGAAITLILHEYLYKRDKASKRYYLPQTVDIYKSIDPKTDRKNTQHLLKRAGCNFSYYKGTTHGNRHYAHYKLVLPDFNKLYAITDTIASLRYLDKIEHNLRVYLDMGILSANECATIYAIYCLSAAASADSDICSLMDITSKWGASKRVAGRLETAGVTKVYNKELRRKVYTLTRAYFSKNKINMETQDMSEQIKIDAVKNEYNLHHIYEYNLHYMHKDNYDDVIDTYTYDDSLIYKYRNNSNNKDDITEDITDTAYYEF